MPSMLIQPARIALTTDAVGGVWTYSLDLARELAEMGAAVELVVLGPPPARHQQHEAACVKGLRLTTADLPLDWTAASPAELEEASRTLFSLLHALKPDIVHLNSPGLAVQAPRQIPLVIGLHSCVASWWRTVHPRQTLPEDLQWRTNAVRRGLSRADAIVVPSQTFASTAVELYDCAGRLEVIPNGRRPDLANKRAARDPEIVLTAGRLWDDAKNAVTLDAAARLLDKPVYAAGPITSPATGSETKAFEHLALLGDLSAASLRDWLARAGVFVSSAIYEPFGLGVLEAAQAGCALVLSDIPTFREFWDDAAIFVPPDNASGFAEAIRTITGDPAFGTVLGAKALRRSERYDTSSMGRKTAALYSQVVATMHAGEGVRV